MTLSAPGMWCRKYDFKCGTAAILYLNHVSRKIREKQGDTARLSQSKKRDLSWLPGVVRMLRLRVKSSLSALRTAVMSSFTPSRLMMSSTRAVLILTFADWPFALAWKRERRKINNVTLVAVESCMWASVSVLSLTFCLLGGVEPGARSSRVMSGADPGGDHDRRPDISHRELTQKRSEHAQMIQSHICQNKREKYSHVKKKCIEDNKNNSLVLNR